MAKFDEKFDDAINEIKGMFVVAQTMAKNSFAISEENNQLRTANAKLREEIRAAIELLEIGIHNAETGIPLWESVGDVQEVLNQALAETKGER